MKFCGVALSMVLAACAAPPKPPAAPVVAQQAMLQDQHVPDFAKRPFEPFTRANAVAITLREWRAFGSIVNNDAPDESRPSLPHDLRRDWQPGLWQRVGEYWWLGQNAGSRESGWTGRYDEFGIGYTGDPAAWSAAFISYVMRSAGAGDRFAYSPLHADYINAAARGLGVVRTEPPGAYAPQPGDLICVGRGTRTLRFEDLPAPRFYAHCDVVVAAVPGQLSTVGGNVDAGVTMRQVPVTAEGFLADRDGQVIDERYKWFVVVRVLYDA